MTHERPYPRCTRCTNRMPAGSAFARSVLATGECPPCKAQSDGERFERMQGTAPGQAPDEEHDAAVVQVLVLTYPHEFSKVLGVYASAELAEAAKVAAVAADESRGYNSFDVEPWAVARGTL